MMTDDFITGRKNTILHPLLAGALIIIWLFTIVRTPFGDTVFPYIDLFSLSAVAVFVTTSVCFARKLFFKKESLVIFVLLFMLFLLSLLSSLWSEYRMLTVQRSFITFLTPLSMVIFTSADRNNMRTFFILSAILFSIGTILSIFGVSIYFFGDAIMVRETQIQILSIGPYEFSQNVMGAQRIGSLLYNPNSLAGVLMISLPLSVGLFIKYKSLAIISGSFLQFVALMLTFSRGGIVTTIVSFVIFPTLLLSRRFKLLEALKIFLSILSSLFLSIILISLSNLSGISRLTSVDLNTRGTTWQVLFDAFVDNPIVGIGFGVSDESVLAEASNVAGSAHNDYLAVLAELGGVGLILFLIIIISVIVIGLRVYLSSQCQDQIYLALSISIFLALCAHGLVETTIIRFGFRHVIWSYMLAFIINYKSDYLK